MEPSISVALDLLRLVAAALVFVHHFEEVTHSALASPFASFGHDSVLFFFVLSGFVIAHVATTTERSASQFAIARVSRLFSVGLPALVLTATLVAIGSLTDLPGRALLSQADWPRIMAASLLFLNESFTSRIEVPTNVPYWSVCYEAWYYVIFALAWYGRGWPRGPCSAWPPWPPA
ncbi:MAG: acyltransferase family protein [Burkholderiaceae bacterium]